MKERIKKLLNSDTLMLIIGFVVVPICSFVLISVSEESPLYTSISRIAWVHGHWFKTFLWALIVMGAVVWLTYRLVETGPLSEKSKKGYFFGQFINILMVFLGCIVFPAKASSDIVKFVNYVHDYLTIVAWALYAVGLLVYSVIIRKKEKFISSLGIYLMIYIIFSSLFFISNVIDPTSYVGASAVSEVYIINSIVIYLMVMCIAQRYTKKIKNNNEA